jgi:hypothetical protein
LRPAKTRSGFEDPIRHGATARLALSLLLSVTVRPGVWCTNWYIRDETLKAATTRLVNFQYHQPLSRSWGGGTLSSSHIGLFRGLHGVHVRCGLSARRAAKAARCFEGFDGFVTSTAAPIATGWSDQFPGGNCTR